MKPLDDHELKLLLRQWQAPPAPAGLKARVLPPRMLWWKWLLNGTLRVPVPVALAAAALLALWLYHSRPASPEPNVRRTTVSLTDFQPVRRLQPTPVMGGQQ